MPAKPRTPAQRQRRLRYRRKHDLLLAEAEVPMSMAEVLIDTGWISLSNVRIWG
jgi:hypothetical protein